VDDHRVNGEDAITPGTWEEPQGGPVLTGDGAAAAEHPEPGLDLGRPTWKLVLTLAWPVFIQQMLILAVQLSDRLLAGRFQAVSAAEQVASQAAQTTASYLSWFLLAYINLVSVGSTALVARFVGAGDRRHALRATNQSFLLAVSLGLAGSIVGLLGLERLIALLQLEGQTAELAVAYLRPTFWFLTLQVIELAGVACLVGAGDTRTGLWVLGGVAILNVPLSWAFFYGLGPLPALGFVGIAMGTGVSHALGGLVVLSVLVRGRAGLRLDLRMLRPDFSLLRRLLRVSVPAAADSLSVSVGQLWFVSIVNNLDDAAQAAHGIALTWEALGYFSGVAVGTAGMALVGQALGARAPHRAAHAGWTAFALGGGLMVAMGALFFTLAPAMFALFCPYPGQRPIIEAGVPVLRLVAFGMPALASCLILTYSLRGAGDTRVPVLISWAGFFAVRIPLAYLLTSEQLDLGALGTLPGASLGLFGAWLAMFADLQVRGILTLWRFATGGWQRIEV
jgi:putative MATE family efflux protein